MIIDTSAAVALLRDEPETRIIMQIIDQTSHHKSLGMSAASVLELSIVTTPSGSQIVNDFLREMRIAVVPVDRRHLKWARYAHAHYGRGSRSPAKLNFGDCLAYAASKAEQRPLLFKGEDFIHTDVDQALPRPQLQIQY